MAPIVAVTRPLTKGFLLRTLVPMTEEQRRGRRAIETGPTGKTVGQNLARLRMRRNFTTRQLSAALARSNSPRFIPASGITRMEQGERQVTVDDLVALAVVLGVNPSALLLPPVSGLQEVVEVTGFGRVPAFMAWDWVDGVRPLTYGGNSDETTFLEFQLLGRPVGRRGLLGITDPESPDWSAARATPGQRLAAENLIFNREFGVREKLAELAKRRQDVAWSDDSDSDKQAELDQIHEEERNARGLLTYFAELRRKEGLGGNEGTDSGN